jgi:DNA-binding MarR family transcriptional regulator
MYVHDLLHKRKVYMQNLKTSSEIFGANCLAYTSRRTARAVTNLFNARMAGLDLNVAQFGLLAAVAHMPGSSLSAIGEVMLLDESTMARNLSVLERRGLVEATGGRGRGGKSVNLTRQGQALHTKGGKIWKETNRELEAALGVQAASAGRAFLEDLSRISERLKAKE